MRLHCLQHVEFEGPANIAAWAQNRGHSLSRTLLFEGEGFPQLDDFDWLVIMGGPMNVYEEDKYPWLAGEKRFLEQAIRRGKIVLGVCLGAQLIADVLGGRVYKNRYKEIGWQPISLTPEGVKSSVFGKFPGQFVAFHWHGDTFDLPPGCTRMAESEGCRNQAFAYEGRVVGLQFHLESSAESIDLLLQNCAEDLEPGKYVQTAEEIRAGFDNLARIDRILKVLLETIEEEFGRG